MEYAPNKENRKLRVIQILKEHAFNHEPAIVEVPRVIESHRPLLRLWLRGARVVLRKQ